MLKKFKSLVPGLAFYNGISAIRHLRVKALDNGCGSLAEYYRLVSSDPGKLAELKENLTYVGTRFFRGKVWLELEKVCKEAGQSWSEKERIRVWCAGCSSGKEVYSVLMILLESVPPGKIELLATDYNHEMLKRCEEAAYPLSIIGEITERFRNRYVETDGDCFRIRKELRDIVRTGFLDLLVDDYPSGFDIVLCRNVIKFFKPGVRRLVQQRLAASLAPGGFLVVSDELGKEGIRNPGKMDLSRIGRSPIYQRLSF